MLKNLSKIILIFLFFGIFYIFIGNHLSVFADSCEGYGSCTRQVTQCTKGDSFCIGGEPGCVCKTSTYTQNVSCRILSAGTCGPNYSEAPGGYGCADFCAYVSSGGSGGGGGGGGSGGGDGGGSGGGGGGTAPTPLPACTTSTVETYRECGPFSGDPNQSCQVRKYVYNESWCASGNQYEVTSCETCARGCSGGTCNSCTDKQVIEIYNECGPFSGDPNQSCQVRKFRYTQPGCPTGDQFELVEGSCKTCTTGCGGGVCKAGSTPVPTSIPTAIPTTAPPPDVGCGAWYCHNGVSADGPRYVCGGTKYLQARQCRAADGSIYYEQRGEDMCSVNTCTVAAAPTSVPPTATKAPTFPTATATLGPYPTYIPPTATKRPTWTSTPTPIGGEYYLQILVYNDVGGDGIQQSTDPQYAGTAAVTIDGVEYIFDGGVKDFTLTEVRDYVVSLRSIPARRVTSANPITNARPRSGGSTIKFGLEGAGPSVPTNTPTPVGTTYNITGTVYVDNDPEGPGLCTSSTPVGDLSVRLSGSTGSIKVASVGSTGTYALNGSTGLSAPYALTVSKTGYSLRAVKTGSGPFVSAGPGDDYPITNLSTTYTFCLKDNTETVVPWFMTQIGSVRQQHITNTVPAGQLPTTTDNTASVFYSTQGVTNLGSALGTKWTVNQEYDRVKGLNRPGNASFSFYKNRAQTAGVELMQLCPGNTGECHISGTTVNAGLANGVYYHPGNVVLDTDVTITNTPKRFVILSEGTITLKGQVRLVNTPNSLIIFAAKQNIIVDPTVGTTPSNTAFNIQAILSAENNIQLPSSASCPTPDKRLNIEGTLIANADNPFGQEIAGGKLLNNRTLCTDNASYPSLFVRSRLSFITQLSDFYKLTSKFWNEVAP